ncbi:unnamed protein product [Arabis nemorensis]|uniref:Uncharacterized protein n=1 Tax=Arabis nemorensis TaxID=586526 RepID=A0A565BRG2_9BRAS|nr:unnamed protein product [Arabis nemorensis]
MIFEDKAITTEDTLLSAISMAREWFDAQQLATPKNRGKNHQAFNLTMDVTTCQSDAAWNSQTKSAGLGWIIFPHETRPLEALALQDAV